MTQYDLGPVAEGYSQFAATLAGFALAGLVVYLGRQYDQRRRPAAGNRPVATAPVDEVHEAGPAAPVAPLVDDIAAALFYAMAALAICAFQYAGLGGEPANISSRGAIALAVYGVVFGLSVLSLFYAIALMIAEHPYVWPAARSVYWVVAVAGPVVAMRFLITANYTVWRYRCPDGCGSPTPWPVVVGVVLLVILLGVSRAVLSWRLRRSDDQWHGSRIWPVKWVFIAAVSVALGSIFITTQRAEFTLPPAMSYVFLGLGAMLLGGFSIACASVFGSRDLNG